MTRSLSIHKDECFKNVVVQRKSSFGRFEK